MNIAFTELNGSGGRGRLLQVDLIRNESTGSSKKLLHRMVEPFSVSSTLQVNWEAVLSSSRESETISSELINAIISEIATVTSVEQIFVKEKNRVVTIWTIINDDDRQVRRNIYEKEENVFDRFPDIKLDFNVVMRRNRPLEEIMSFDREPIYKRD
ncbi:MAG TPA: hypothetical protein VFF49_02045 [Thermodesulfobacteriota bacterium]|nr:hypothetical protein [Thermodesulfobacteriota bacterium]